MAAPGNEPAPLRLPAILQNPVSSAQRQVEAHNAQQRERLAARRDRERAARSATSADGKLSGKGKRVIRRYDNATFADNPHIALPRRSDLFPPVPLHPRAARSAFPPYTIPRASSIAHAAPPDRNPLSDSSVSGGFSTSLKGVRALLRKGGRRAEVLIPRVEAVIRGWLEGAERVDRGREAVHGEGEGEGWSVVDPTLTEFKVVDVSGSGSNGQEEDGPQSAHEGGSTSAPPLARRLPPTLRPPNPLPALPVKNGQVPAILEITRSPAHISLAVIDPYDRLIVHLLARYYECLSWSEEHPSSNTVHPPIRLTHLIIPHLLRPKASHRAQVLTPETTDISGQSASEVEAGLSESDDTSSGAESDATVGGSARGLKGRNIGAGKEADGAGLSEGECDVEGYYLDSASERSFGGSADDGASRGGEEVGDETLRAEEGTGEDTALRARLARIALEDTSDTRLVRVSSRDSVRSAATVDTVGSSHYASSEASEFTTASSIGMGDSMTLPPADGVNGANGVDGANRGLDGWQSHLPNSVAAQEAMAQRQVNKGNLPKVMGAVGQVKARQGWEDRPTFFDYLYGS